MTTLASLIADLKASLLDSASSFIAEDFERHVQAALKDYSRRRPLEMVDELTLQSGLALYDCPADLTVVLGCDWGRDAKLTLDPWDDRWPGTLPSIRVMRRGGERVLRLTPAPSARQIGLLGSACPYRYGAAHLVTENDSTLQEQDAPLVVLRAQAEVMRELAMKNSTQPYQVRDGISATPKNGTPSYLHTVLMDEFERRLTL
ncbi:phage adaptor protein [Pseudogulbenkiania ferrooxidans]|uniref:Uncharacterized protein n=1 Tax=Pseudogulbenkiania ferrooxidans 2002 TaxID=279714 RepID=B9Z506_9NEIS|nr:hypothetical protein [Pseudogulbenkiania ferrooxidans]EEG08238.1 conserved hypothetical protein [Pseudogulbenkiania ferrooxidans 2002]